MLLITVIITASSARICEGTKLPLMQTSDGAGKTGLNVLRGKITLQRKTNLRLSFTREDRVNTGCGSETERHRVSAIKMEVKSCLGRHSASKEILPVLAQRQEGRTTIQTPERGRYSFRALNGELLLQSQCLHGNCSISLIASTSLLQHVRGDQQCRQGSAYCHCTIYRKKDTGCLHPSQIPNLRV